MPKKDADNKKTDAPDSGLDLENILSELGSEGSLAISRIEPSWCKGHVRTITLNGAERVSIEWIAEKFGGEKLQCRVYGPDGHKMIKNRTVDVCAPPKNGHGIELVRGPDGAPVPVTQLQEARRRYEIAHGITPAAPDPAQPAAPAAPDPQSLNANTLLASLLNAQAQSNQAMQAQNQNMQTMLINRIGTLERQLMASMQGAGGAPAAAPTDPLQNLDNFVATAHKFHEVKKAMGLGDAPPAVEDSEANTFLELAKGFLELEAEKVKARQQPGGPPALPAYGYQQPPPPADQGVPPGSVPPPDFMTQQPPGPPPPAAPGQLTDDQLKMIIAQRLPSMLANASPAERLAYAQEVAGQEFDLGRLEDYELDDPAGAETEQTSGQDLESILNLEDIDQSGVEHGDQDPSCDNAAKAPDRRTPTESVS